LSGEIAQAPGAVMPRLSHTDQGFDDIPAPDTVIQVDDTEAALAALHSSAGSLLRALLLSVASYPLDAITDALGWK
jgi:hypothetical protein